MNNFYNYLWERDKNITVYFKTPLDILVMKKTIKLFFITFQKTIWKKPDCKIKLHEMRSCNFTDLRWDYRNYSSQEEDQEKPYGWKIV